MAGKSDIVQLLLDHGANVNARNAVRNENNYNPFPIRVLPLHSRQSFLYLLLLLFHPAACHNRHLHASSLHLDYGLLLTTSVVSFLLVRGLYFIDPSIILHASSVSFFLYVILSLYRGYVGEHVDPHQASFFCT